MTTIILWVCTVLTALLGTYALGHALSMVAFLPGAPARRAFDAYPEDSAAVLIPARNEGQGALRVIHSLLQQDHAGTLAITLLLKDRSDTSLPFLKEQFPDADFSGDTALVQLTQNPRRVLVAFTGADPKSDKLNWARPELTTRYTAILDCDHQARPDWIRTSICLLQEQGAKFVQGTRAPIDARGIFALWDALHQHIGCELYNLAFTHLGLTVFFTGTTVVMETELLAANAFNPCITEDTDYGYGLLMQGHRIIHNPYSGSEEEVSPDLYSFLARRRRWANGHTEAFFRHLPKMGRSPLDLRHKVQFLFHGVHYLIVLLVFVLHGVIGLYFLPELNLVSQLGAAAVALLTATAIGLTQRSVRWSALFTEIGVVFVWLFPAVVIGLNLLQAILLEDLSRAAVPIPEGIQALGLVALAMPLMLLVVALQGLGQLGFGSFFAVVLSYPMAFYMDISGVLIGLSDYLFDRQHWRAVARAPDVQDSASYAVALSPVSSIRDSWRPSLVLRESLRKAVPTMNKPARWIPWIAIASVVGLGLTVTRATRIPVAPANCQVLEHDTDPWVVHPARLNSYCDTSASVSKPAWTRRSSKFQLIREDNLNTLDPAYWDRMDSTFYCNEAAFTPENIVAGSDGGVAMVLKPGERLDRAFTAGDLATKDTPEANFLYGRFETQMKPMKGSGVISAMFLYRFDPWQEIDMEFLGRDTTKIMLNVYYNPGAVGDLYNYGYRGTPVLIDLGFDAADDFHTYAVEWDVDEIRWFVDDKLIHKRSEGRPTPIPHLPMRLHMNAWPMCSEELVGPFTGADLPLQAEFRSVRISGVAQAPLARLLSWMDPPSSRRGQWQDEAEWIQP